MTTTISELRQRSQTAYSTLDELLNRPSVSKFDPDAWHVMQIRDDQLIRDSVLHGSIIKDYVYSFSIKGNRVTGISVIGARQLAVEYKGIKSRLVGSSEKTGQMFVFRSFDPMTISVQHIPELGDEQDFYECIVEVADIKTGNAIQVRKKEYKTEKKNDGSTYNRPHYDVIAESKAFRNGVLSIIPQSVVSEFEQKALKAGNGTHEMTIDQRREALISFASKHGIKIIRVELFKLSYADLDGLSDAAKSGKAEFKKACVGAGVVLDEPEVKTEQSNPSEQTLSRHELINQETGEIKQYELDKKPPSSAVLDWLSHIEGVNTKSDISRTHKAIEEDKRLSKDEKADLVEELKTRQSVM